MNNKLFSLLFLALLVLSAWLIVSFKPVPEAQSGPLSLQGETLKEESFDQRRGKLLNELSDAVNAAVLMGKYRCCIEPACTMCYLGDWIWNDGTCDCDGMIARGEFDKVCPQCKKGIEEGRCISTLKNAGACPT